MCNAVKITDVMAGDVLVADDGFTCIAAGDVVIEQDGDGLFFRCSEGRHGLDGQLDFDDQVTLVGLTRPEKVA